MLGKQKTNILLIVIVAIGFLYRFYLTTMNVFPSGSDIGLHESVINSLLAPKSSLFYNYYHMGGGLSATNPGYHIFAVFIITMTGAPDYLVQAAVASLFSALIIAGAFLVTELVWGELAGFIVAILVTFSASDTIMLSWAGYPNIVALALIPILFYLFLQPAKFSSKNFLGAASIIVAALFLTHLFSALVFLGITIVALSASLLFRRSTGFTVNKAFLWLIPIFFGVLLVAPYLINVLPLYFGSQGAITGTVAVMKQAVVETRVIPTTILCLSIVPLILFPLFSRFQKGKFLSLPTILFASAILVPLAATQSYLLGFYLDYERFLYFLALPAIICVGLVVISSSNIIARGLGRIRKTLKVVSGPVLLSILVIVCLLTPLFALPSEGAAQANFFQVMTPNKYDAIQWAKASTPANATFVADAEFGWWLSGFGQRPTLSAVDPQYLILQHEFGPASVASNMLSADYSIDNGLLQVKQEGAYANGSSHNLYAITNESYIYPLIFSLNDTQISLLYRTGGIPQQTTLGAFTQSNTEVTNNGNSASFLIKRENSSFNITEEITMFSGVRFAKVTFIFQKQGAVNFDWLQIPFQTRGFPIQTSNSIGFVDNSMHQINQLVFPDGQLGNEVIMQQNPDFYELIYNLQGNSTAQVSFFVGLCPFNANSTTPQTDYFSSLIEKNSQTYLNTVSNAPLNCFDYQTAIKQWNISYVAITNPDTIPRFLNDPTFELAFKNSEVAIFKIR